MNTDLRQQLDTLLDNRHEQLKNELAGLLQDAAASGEQLLRDMAQQAANLVAQAAAGELTDDELHELAENLQRLFSMNKQRMKASQLALATAMVRGINRVIYGALIGVRHLP